MKANKRMNTTFTTATDSSTRNYCELEKSVANAGSQLFSVATKLSEVERSLDNTNIDEIDEICVNGLLASMNDVKREYQSLRQDIKEVQELQKDVTSSIRFQMRTMHQTFKILKQRLELTARRKI